MKKLLAGMAVSVFSLLAAQGAFFPGIAGPATLDLTAITTENRVVQSKTNVTAAGTNFLTVIKGSVDMGHFTDSNLLALIENSLSTNFPAGSQIGMSNEIGFVILNSTGTQVIFVPDSVIAYAQDTNFLVSADVTQVRAENTNGAFFSGNAHPTIFQRVMFTYDDTSLNPRDGKHTLFQFTGLKVTKEATILKTKSTKQTYEIQGTGDEGLVDGVPTILIGTISAKINGRFDEIPLPTLPPPQGSQ